MSVRICVLCDFDTNDPVEAYRQLREQFNQLIELDYETADEDWFYDDGSPLSTEEIEEARMTVLDAEMINMMEMI